jgi:lipopolysaccharide transport system ATP-binding protein
MVTNQIKNTTPSRNRDVLVRVENVGKIFCRDLRKSLLYGVGDVIHEFLPFIKGRKTSESGEIHLRSGEFWANKDITFEVRRGECLGLIGRNGAGKTTLLRMLNGLIKPDTGFIETRGRVGAIIALGAGFNPILTGRENVYVNGSLLGLSKKEIDDKIDDIIAFAEIGDFIDSPVQSYSSGMNVRLGFAVATAMEPDVLILDEVLAVGDGAFRSKCLKRIGAISRNSAILFVTHDMGHVSRICDKVLCLERGRPLFLGDKEEGLRRYHDTISGEPVEVNAPELHDDVEAFWVLQPEGGFSTKTGDSLEIVFEITARREIVTESCSFYFMDQQRVLSAHADFSSQLPMIPRGRSRITIKLPSVHLSMGSYQIHMQIFAKGGRDPIVHGFGTATLHVHGPQRMWCSYRMPVTGVSVEEQVG